MTSPPPTPGALPRRDALAILLALGGLTVVAWAYLFELSRRMDAMQPGAMGAAMGIQPWGALEWWLMFAMWAVMMVGMMVPTAAPMALVYAMVARKAARAGTTLAPTAVFVGGYVAVWTAFSAVATAAQWALDQAALLSPMMVTTSPALGAGLLLAAGAYQLTPLKQACLVHCRAPARFLAENWRPGLAGAFALGVRHGAFCLGCCWLLMGLLFFGGVMNLLWIAGMTAFVLLEKLAPRGLRGGRIAGGAMVAAGLLLLVRLL